nr:MAG TPA: Rifin [Caudoviricetes sp.]
MYISEFACGVFATLITEIVLIIGYAIYARKKK